MERNALAGQDWQTEASGTADIIVGTVRGTGTRPIESLSEIVAAGMKEYFPQYSWKMANASLLPPARSAAEGSVSIPIQRFGVHHVTYPWHGVPAKTNGYRAIFEYACQMHAKVCLLVDPEQVGIQKDWIDALVRPLIHSKYDLVAPVHGGSARQQSISGNLLAPVVRALFGRGPRQPMSGELAISAKMLSRLLSRHDWDSSVARYTPELWIAFIAAAEQFRVAESAVSPSRTESRGSPISRQSAIAQIVGGLFDLLEQYENRWPTTENALEPMDLFGPAVSGGGKSDGNDGLKYLGNFVEAFPSLQSHWRLILTPHTFAEVEFFFEAIRSGESNRYLSDAAWVRTVYEVASAWKRKILPRSQIIGLFTPLLMGRLGSFLMKTQWMEQTEVEMELARLATYFEALQPAFQRLWHGHSDLGLAARAVPPPGEVAAC
jgi:glucosylglycerate synthase